MFCYSEQTSLQPLTNSSEDSQAWKTYSYLDEGAARGTELDNRRRIRCTVALHWEWLQHHPLYRRQSNLAVMCKDTYLPGEDFSSTFLEKNGNECWQQHDTVLYSKHLISIEKLLWEKKKKEKSRLKDQFLISCECNNTAEHICNVLLASFWYPLTCALFTGHLKSIFWWHVLDEVDVDVVISLFFPDIFAHFCQNLL